MNGSMIRLPVFSLLLLWAFQAYPPHGEPVNLFRPDSGQRTSFLFVPVQAGQNGMATDTTTYWITGTSGDSAFYRVMDSRGTRSGSGSFLALSQGVVTAPLLLKTASLDTNGIFGQVKTFPADYSVNTVVNRAWFGYVLGHVVDGYAFDTLLVSCRYFSATDRGDICDFVTPSGFFVYTNVHSCFCNPSSYRLVPDGEALAAMGGRPVPNLAKVRASARGPGGTAASLIGMFDLRGRRLDGAFLSDTLRLPSPPVRR